MSKDSDPKQWYIEHRFLRQNETVGFSEVSVDRVIGVNGKLEYFLCKSGIPIGKLDPKRLWASRLILVQEEKDVHATESGTWPENNDGGAISGQQG